MFWFLDQSIDRDSFKEHLEWAEGRRQYPYEDSVGKLTIGIGRNLDDRGLSNKEIDYLLSNDIDIVISQCEELPYWEDLDGARRMVVADMVFNMGISRFRGFINTNRALRDGNYSRASNEIKDSRYYRQTGRRAVKNARVMKTGEWT